jgi:DNA-binding response OmpR family regulator
MAHLLLIEDDIRIAQLLRIRLEHRGHRVSCVADGNQTLARACIALPDLILLDLCLPGMHGLAVLQQLKHHPTTHAIPVLLLTAQTDGSSVVAGLGGGADAYLTKPIDFAALLSRVEFWLTRHAKDSHTSIDVDDPVLALLQH